MSTYEPPFRISDLMISLVSEISEEIGKLAGRDATDLNPRLRKANRVQTIQASLAIENNTLTLDQVTAILNGKRVLGHPREIQEVKSAFKAYDLLTELNPHSEKDLLKAHSILMKDLIDSAGKYRTGGVGIMNAQKVVHVAPQASRVPILMRNLFLWLKKAKIHPLIASSVFHYEFEFIHPFEDGNGRMGRYWQTLLLSRWKPVMAYLPVETIIYRNQKKYYAVLGEADQKADCSIFIELILKSILEALKSLKTTDQVADQVSDQVKLLLKVMSNSTMTSQEIMQKLNLAHRPTFRKNYLHPAIEAGLVEMTIPDKPNSRFQKYRVTHRLKN
jgi:Fic family protein